MKCFQNFKLKSNDKVLVLFDLHFYNSLKILDFRLCNVGSTFSGIAYSSIACGMLHYLEGLLLNDESNNEPEIVHFVLLDEIATQQPGLHIRWPSLSKDSSNFTLKLLFNFRNF